MDRLWLNPIQLFMLFIIELSLRSCPPHLCVMISIGIAAKSEVLQKRLSFFSSCVFILARGLIYFCMSYCLVCLGLLNGPNDGCWEDTSFSSKFTPARSNSNIISQKGEGPSAGQLTNPGQFTNPGHWRRCLVHPDQFTKQTHVYVRDHSAIFTFSLICIAVLLTLLHVYVCS